MSSQLFSRSFLKGIPGQRKEQEINRLIQGFINDLENAAAAGKTSFMYCHDNNTSNQGVRPPVITTNDLIAAFQLKFPDCGISYPETWVEADQSNKFLKKGIVIDWS